LGSVLRLASDRINADHCGRRQEHAVHREQQISGVGQCAAAAGVVNPADPSVTSWGDSGHDDATIIVALAEQLSKRTIPKCPTAGP
jgi:hypothetical protein